MIRRATVEDSAAIAEIHVASWRTTYRGQVPDDYLDSLSVPPREAAWRDIFNDPRSRILVAEQGEVVVGFICFGQSRDPDCAPDGSAEERVGEIYSMYLRKESQGRGLGRQLWAQAIEALGAESYGAITVWVLNTNITARRFYESMGCRLDGESKPDTIGSQEVTELRYRLSLR